MATIHLIEGPVGAGKSTVAARQSLSHRAPHLNLDEWMATLFSPDRPTDNFMGWCIERKQRCLQQIWEVTCELMNSGIDVVLELGLVQTVDREDNPRYWKLIKSFEEITGVPVLLNTSFNENEPIVCNPSEAIECFLRTKMDVLVLGSFWVERKKA